MLSDQKTKVSVHPEIFTGISTSPKKISSWYFYDEKGSRLFEAITRLDEYYLTNKETKIFECNAREMVDVFTHHSDRFINVVELGAGDGIKTKILLKHLQNEKTEFLFSPIDISEEALQMLEKNVKEDLPDIRVNALKGDYFNQLETIGRLNHGPKVILFLGSSIGNYSNSEAVAFLKQLRNVMGPQDQLMIGFDMVKNANVVLNAYNDKHGVTSKFNKNLLVRMNEEFDANFNLNCFEHCAAYDPVKQAALSYLVSTKKQEVVFRAMDKAITFEAWETIHTETSQKYTPASILEMATMAGFRVKKWFEDEEKYFSDVIFELD